MAPCRAASARQIELLLEFAERNLNVALGGLGGGPLGRQVASKKWEDLSRKLNSVGTGCNKTPMEWKRYWTLLKSRTKGKAGDLRRAATGTGGGPNYNTPLTPIEERIIGLSIGIIGKVAVEGEPEVQIPINIPDLPTQQSTCPSPVDEIIIDEQLSNNYTTAIDEPLEATPNLQHITTSAEVTQSVYTSRIVDAQIPEPLPPASTQRRRPLRSVENAPQWAIDVEKQRIEGHNNIISELKGIKEALKEQTIAINRIGDLLSVWIEKSYPS